MKKILAILLSLSLLFSQVPVFAISTDNSSSPWTIEKAEHLARRTLFRVTPDIVNQLYQAGSADAAVNILFTPPSTSDTNTFSQELNQFLQGKSVADAVDMGNIYLFDLYRDPFDAKRKLFTLLEDIFSVAPVPAKNLNYAHIRAWHQKIYEKTLGNYKDLVYQSIYDYAPTKFLDLLNVNPQSPNENFARELMQLFLMEEYLPLDTSHQLGRNYSEEDVAALAKILTGFTSLDNVTVTYDPSKHNTTPQTFLGGSYANASDDPAKVVDYIFQKKSKNIAQFITWRLYKFYISETLSQSDLDTFSDIFIQNNFEIAPLVKTMLTSSQMYSNASMNEIRYKNPLELTVGTQALLQQDNAQGLDLIVSQSSTKIGFTPYNPGSIFGRPGMDKNAEWMNAFVYNQWLQLAPQFVFRDSSVWKISDFVSRLKSSVSTSTTSKAFIAPEVEIIQESSDGSFQEVPLDTAKNSATDGEASTPMDVPPPVETSAPLPLPTEGTSVIPKDATVSDTPSSSGALSEMPSSSTTNTLPTEEMLRTPTPEPLPVMDPKVEEEITLPSSQTLQPTSFLRKSKIIRKFSTQQKLSWIDFLIPRTYADTILSPQDLIQFFEKKLYLGRALPTDVRQQLITYLTSTNGQVQTFSLDDLTYQNTKIKGLVALMLMQPEYLLQSGYDQQLAVASSTTGTGKFEDKGSLVLMSFGGGADWLQIVAPTDDSTYKSFRGGLALGAGEALDLDRGLKINSVFQPIYNYFKTGELRIINSVGVPGHSRSHSFAREQMESGLLTGFGAMGKGFSQDTSGVVSQISLYSGIPKIFEGAPVMTTGSASARITAPSGLSATEGTEFLKDFQSIAKTRQFPGDIGNKLRDALSLDTIAQTAGTPGGSNDQQLAYVKTLISNGIGKVYYVNINGGYDTHGNQKAGMNTNLATLATRMAKFYEDMKAINKKVTIVTFSEFGRTNKTNGSQGTDHGEGGGMLVLSNEGTNLHIPSMAGNIDLASEKDNWLTPKIDVRAAWNTFMGDIFGIDTTQTFPLNPRTNKVFSMLDYTDAAAPNIINLQENIIDAQHAQLQFDVSDAEGDFDIKGVSKVKCFVGSSQTDLTSEIPVTASGGHFFVDLTLIPGQEYFYKIRVNDENYNTRELGGSVQTPSLAGASGTVPTGASTDYLLPIVLPLTKPFLLSAGTTNLYDAGDPSLSITFSPRTNITNVQATTSGGSVTWNGLFQAPKKMTIASGEMYSGKAVKARFQVGPTSVALTLDTSYIIQVPVQDPPSTFVDVFHSYDGSTWTSYKTEILVSSSKIAQFNADKFGYFMLIDNPKTPSFIPVVPPVSTASTSTSTSSTTSSSTSSSTTSTSSSTTSSSTSSTTSSSTSSSTSTNTPSSSQAATTGSGGALPIPSSGPYLLNIGSRQQLELISRDASFEKTLGIVPYDITLKNQGITLFIPYNTKISSLTDTAFTGIFQTPTKLPGLKRPQNKPSAARELMVFQAGDAFKDLKANNECVLEIDLSVFDIDWEHEKPQIFYFDTQSGEYKRVNEGGEITAQKTITVHTKYMNIWGVFAVQK